MRYAPAADVLESTLDDELVLMSVQGGMYYGLDGVAARIWTLLKEKPLSLTDLCQALQLEYEVAPDACEQDTHSFLEQLTKQGLLVQLAAP